MLKYDHPCRNFFIVGAQKAGTTALHQYLSKHPEISISTPKELHFFDNETIDWRQPNYASLEIKMRTATKKVWGEATPIYMYWPESIERLQAFDPSAKIIVLLRHPVFRAHSHWRMETIRQAEDLSFSEAIREGRSRVKKAKNGVHRVHSYVERGFYADQIKRILNFFPRSQVHFLTNDQLWLEPAEALKKIERFLSVNEELNPERRYVIAARTNILDQMQLKDYSYLMELFENDIVRSEEITGIPLSKWLENNYQEPVKG